MKTSTLFHISAFLLVAVLIILPGAVTFAQPPAAHSALPNAHSPLGTNFDFVRDWSSEIPFVDAFKTSRVWYPQCVGGQQPDCTWNNAWDTGERNLIDLDENGWVRSLPRPQDPPIFWRVGTLLFREVEHYPAGQYVVLYDGEGTLEYGFDAGRDAVASSPGRDIINVIPTRSGIWLTIAATDPNHTGNYLRNIRVIMPGFESNYAAQIFHPDFLQKIERYKVLRFKDWMETDGSTQGDWARRPRVEHARWSTGAGVPLEIMVPLANRTGSDPWVNMPHQATDEYVTQFATMVRDSLDSNRRVYVEYSNEVWNDAYPFSIEAQWVEQQGIARWPNSSASNFTKRVNWFGLRTAQICDLWKSAWGAQSGRVVCVMGAFAANAWVGAQALDCPLWTEGAPCSAHGIDALAIGPYFGGYLTNSTFRDQVIGWTSDPDGGLGRLFDELLAGGQLAGGPQGGALQVAFRSIDPNYSAASARGVALVAYEGGQGLVDPQHNAALQTLFANANHDPRMGPAYDQYLAGWRAHGGQLFVHFKNVARPSVGGSFGALDYVDQNSSPKFDALMRFVDSNPCWWPGCADTTSTPTPGATETNAPTSTPTRTTTPTAASSDTPTRTPTNMPTDTPTPTATDTPTPMRTFTPTRTATLAPTPTPTRCATKPPPPTLASPANGATVTPQAVPLDWTDSPCAAWYDVVVKQGSPTGSTADSKTTLTNSQYTTKALARNKTYYWRVRACNAKGCSAWTAWWNFKVSATPASAWRRDDWMSEPQFVVAQRLE